MRARTLVSRLRRMTGDEVSFRLGAAIRSEAARLAAAWHPPAWRRERLGALLEPAGAELARAVAALRRGDAAAGHDALLKHFRERENVFPVAPAGLGSVAARVGRLFPAAPESALREARLFEQGRFDLLGYEDLDFRPPGAAPGAIDWQWDPVHRRRPPIQWWSRVPYLDPASGDHKIIWELNRHQHFLRLGRAAWLTRDASCRRTFASHVAGWLVQNPPGVGVNWASMLELSFRSLSWLWGLHFFTALPAGGREDDRGASWIPDLLLGIHVQLEHVRANLSRYFSPNTHLTGEALGLYVCGRALPELRAARGWAETGRDVLVEQLGKQVAPDGGHCERSTHYHRYTLDFCLAALAFARSTGDACADVFAEAAERTAEAAAVLADSHGRLPLIGDDDGGRLFPLCAREPNDIRDSLALAAVLLRRPDLATGPAPEEPLWMVGETAAGLPAEDNEGAARTVATCTALPYTGYYTSRPRRGDHVVFDAGPHGFLNGGHAHADALSLVYSVRGRALAIDPGTATYTMSAEMRDRLRSSQSHNTLTLDGRSQSVPAGPFAWRNAAAASLQACSSGQGYDYFEGVHDAYLPAVHRRRVVALALGCLVVVDSVLGDGEHTAEVYWHLDPAWMAERGGGSAIRLVHRDGSRAVLVAPGIEAAVLAGDETPGLGWSSPVYGRVLPSPTVRLLRRAPLPLTIVSVLADAPSGEFRVSEVPAVDEAADAGDDSIAVELESGDNRYLLLFTARPPVLPGDARAPRTVHQAVWRRFQWHETEVAVSARFAWLSRRAGEEVRQRACDGGLVELNQRRRAAGAA